VGAVIMSAYMSIPAYSLYVGGIPANIGLDPTLIPVRHSLMGGAILSLHINSVYVTTLYPFILLLSMDIYSSHGNKL